MSDGMLRPCLGNELEIPLKAALKEGDEVLLEILKNAIYFKPIGHHFESCSYTHLDMSRIGG